MGPKQSNKGLHHHRRSIGVLSPQMPGLDFASTRFLYHIISVRYATWQETTSKVP